MKLVVCAPRGDNGLAARLDRIIDIERHNILYRYERNQKKRDEQRKKRGGESKKTKRYLDCVEIEALRGRCIERCDPVATQHDAVAVLATIGGKRELVAFAAQVHRVLNKCVERRPGRKEGTACEHKTSAWFV